MMNSMFVILGRQIAQSLPCEAESDTPEENPKLKVLAMWFLSPPEWPKNRMFHRLAIWVCLRVNGLGMSNSAVSKRPTCNPRRVLLFAAMFNQQVSLMCCSHQKDLSWTLFNEKLKYISQWNKNKTGYFTTLYGIIRKASKWVLFFFFSLYESELENVSNV